MKVSLSFLLLCSIASAQLITFGAKAGGILTEPGERYDESRRYIVGPYLEVRLPLRFAIEGGALYSRFGSSIPLSASTGSLRTRGDLWQFPILGKYYVTAGPRDGGIHPFLSAGVVLRKVWLDNSRVSLFSVRAIDYAAGLLGRVSDSGAGASFGGGLDVRVKRIGLSPEFRYVRWEGQRFPATNPNEAQILLGIHF
jgi:hypothetical protein